MDGKTGWDGFLSLSLAQPTSGSSWFMSGAFMPSLVPELLVLEPDVKDLFY